MNKIFILGGCSTVLLLTSCLKGHIPHETIIPEARIDSVFLHYFQQQTGVIAAEGTTSLPLSDGRTLWLFGTAHLNDYQTGTGMMNCLPNAHNAAMISSSTFTMQTLNTGNSDFLPSNETDTWFKPLHAYQYDDTVFVFAKKSGATVLNARTYIAKYHFPDLQLIRIDSMLLNQTIYGYTCFTDTATGFCYVYGLYRPDTLADNALYCARFPMNDLQAKWQYYAENDWVDPPSSALPVAWVPAENFSLRKIQNRYMLLTRELGKACNKGRKIYARSSSNPFGTFLNEHLVYEIGDSLGVVTPVCSDIALHPQWLQNGEVLLTYSIWGYGTCIPTCQSGFDNPDFYRIRTLRIPLKKLDSAF
ncbi:MAG TPA: hypothetical protein PLP14_00120 [Chitinophagaceae bacterium]|nr:hypothetical protein [Chitinophagaceae bacterium]